MPVVQHRTANPYTTTYMIMLSDGTFVWIDALTESQALNLCYTRHNEKPVGIEVDGRFTPQQHH